MGLGDFFSSVLGTSNKYSQPREILGLQNAIPGMQQGNQQFLDFLRAQGQGGSAAQNALMANQGPDYSQVNPTLGQTQGVTNRFLDIAAGRGPNPALAQLGQTTGQNIARTQGMIGSERSLNPALAARMGANTAGDLNQQANQQAALLSSQQQLGALGQAGGLSLNAANLLAGMAQQANAQRLAGLQASGALGLGGQQLAAQTGLGLQGMDLNAVEQQQGINAGVRGQNANINAGLVGGLAGGAGKGAAAAGLVGAQGGEVMGYAQGGQPMGMADGGDPYSMMLSLMQMNSGLDSGQALGQGMRGASSAFMPRGPSGGTGAPPLLSNTSSEAVGVNAAPFPGSQPMLNSQPPVMSFAPPPMARGGYAGKVPGKPQHPGNDSRNDTVSAKLSPGEIVLPNTVTQAPDAERRAAEFVQAVRAKHMAEGGEMEDVEGEPEMADEEDEPGEGYSKVLALHRKLEKRLGMIEQHFAKGGKAKGGRLVYFKGGKAGY